MAAPALCVHIPFSHCPDHAIQWHSLPLQFIRHSCGFIGSQEPAWRHSGQVCRKAGLLLAEGSFTFIVLLIKIITDERFLYLKLVPSLFKKESFLLLLIYFSSSFNFLRTPHSGVYNFIIRNIIMRFAIEVPISNRRSQ